MKIHSYLQTAIYTISVFLFISLGIFVSNHVSKAQVDNNLSARLSGKILLQVEENGEAWYVSPDNNKRVFLNRPADAFNIMRTLGLGVSEADYNLFINSKVPARLSGKILLRVESNGEAYYVNPDDMTMHYLNRPSDAFSIMRALGLGISNNNLAKIATSTLEEIISEKETATNTGSRVTTNKPELMTSFTHILSVSADIANIDNIKEKGFLYLYSRDKEKALIPTLDNYEQKVLDYNLNKSNTINVDITNLKPLSYSYIRAYVIDNNNNVSYGNIEIIDSVGKKGLPAMPVASPGSSQLPNGSGGNNDNVVATQHTLSYAAGENGLLSFGATDIIWQEESLLPAPRLFGADVVINDKIYVAGGMTDGWDFGYNNLLIYEPGGLWTEATNTMSIDRSEALAVNLNDKMYVIGGWDIYDWMPTSSVEVYDPISQSWSIASSTNEARSSAFGAVYENEIYLLGGENYGAFYGADYDSIEIYNPGEDKWRYSDHNLPLPISRAAAEIVGNTLYIIGGLDGAGEIIDKVYSLDLSSSSSAWQELASLPESRYDGGSVYNNGYIYYFGGIDYNDWLVDSIFVYNIVYDNWQELDNLPIIWYKPMANVIDDMLYLSGGGYTQNSWLETDSNYSTSIANLERGIKRTDITLSVTDGEDGASIYASADYSYYFLNWSDGSTDNPRTDSNVQSDINVVANFAINTYTINYSSDINGSLIGSTTQVVGYGSNTTAVEAIPNIGYSFLKWSDGVTDNPRTDSSISENSAIEAIFIDDNSFVMEFSMLAGQTLTLPLIGAGYNATIDWGDGSDLVSITSETDPNRLHTYEEAGNYFVIISGSFPRIYFNNTGSKNNLIKIVQWGNVGFTSFLNAFSGCVGLSSLPDGPITGAGDVTSFEGAFQHTSLTSIPAGLFDYTPLVTSFSSAFSRNNSITAIPAGLFDYTPNVTDFSLTFSDNSIIEIPIGLFDNNTQVTTFYEVFKYNFSLTGLAPALWLRLPEPIGIQAFEGATGLSNYADIPLNWK